MITSREQINEATNNITSSPLSPLGAQMALITCPECFKKIASSSKHCIGCGMPVEEMKFIKCPRCGESNRDKAKYCKGCGINIKEELKKQEEAKRQQELKKQEEIRKKEVRKQEEARIQKEVRKQEEARRQEEAERQEVERIERAKEEHIKQLIEQGQKQLEQKNYGRSLFSFNKVIDLDETNRVAQKNILLIRNKLKDYYKRSIIIATSIIAVALITIFCIIHIQKIQKANREYIDLFNAGEESLKTNNYEEAFKCYENALKYCKNDTQAKEKIEYCKDKLYEINIQHGQEYVKSGKWPEAIAAYQTALNYKSGDIKAATELKYAQSKQEEVRKQEEIQKQAEARKQAYERKKQEDLIKDMILIPSGEFLMRF